MVIFSDFVIIEMDMRDITYFSDYIEKIDLEEDDEKFNLEIDETAFKEEPIKNNFTDKDLIELLTSEQIDEE